MKDWIIKFCKYFLCFYFYQASGIFTYAQEFSGDLEAASGGKITCFIQPIIDREVNLNHFIVNGRAYYSPYAGAKGHPFFLENSWQKGTVIKGGNQFYDLELKYDIYQDALVYRYNIFSGSVKEVVLKKQDVSSFTIGNTAFINIKQGIYEVNPKLTGYYQLIYMGRAGLLVRKTKSIDVTVTADNPYGEYIAEPDQICILKDNMLFKLKYRNSLIRILNENKEEVKSFMKDNHMTSLRMSLEQVREVLVYFNSLDL